MQLPGGAAWVPQTPTQLTPAATPNSAMPQTHIAYPTMQQFQVSPQVIYLFIFIFIRAYSKTMGWASYASRFLMQLKMLSKILRIFI